MKIYHVTQRIFNKSIVYTGYIRGYIYIMNIYIYSSSEMGYKKTEFYTVNTITK